MAQKPSKFIILTKTKNWKMEKAHGKREDFGLYRKVNDDAC